MSSYFFDKLRLFSKGCDFPVSYDFLQIVVTFP